MLVCAQADVSGPKLVGRKGGACALRTSVSCTNWTGVGVALSFVSVEGVCSVILSNGSASQLFSFLTRLSVMCSKFCFADC